MHLNILEQINEPIGMMRNQYVRNEVYYLHSMRETRKLSGMNYIFTKLQIQLNRKIIIFEWS